jgi:bifunctional NMN adenylyltransferase/nudix hydrolase
MIANPATTAAVVIGRFPLCTHAHTEMIERALLESSRTVVFVRSAFHPRIPRDPFTWEERVQMIIASLRPELRERYVGFLPARDQYDVSRWSAEVLAHARVAAGDAGHVRLYVERSPAWQCPEFDRWGWERVERIEADEQHGSRLLAMVLQAAASPRGAQAIDEALAHVETAVAPEALERVREWTRAPHFAGLVEEQKALDAARAQWSTAPYEPIFSTVDCVVQCAGHVLLVQRKNHPGKGLWALPGGFVEPRESLRTSAMRELAEETGLGVDERELLSALREARVYDQPDRSQRGRTITHVHHFYLGERELPGVLGSDDAAEARWIPVESLAGIEEQLFEDHFQILDDFLGITR